MTNGSAAHHQHRYDTLVWAKLMSSAQHRAKPSAVRELLKLTSRPNILSFAGGIPDPSLLPLKEIEECLHKTLATHNSTSLQYGISEGRAELREELKKLANRQGRPCEIDNILITHGSQQAISLLADLFIDSGDPIVVTRPCYLGALQVFTQRAPTYIEVSYDAEGPSLRELESALQRRPKFFYLVPAFSNPTGISISPERGRAILDLCRRYEVPILEDGAYRELHYDGEPISLRKLEGDYLEQIGESYDSHGQVIYLGTLSKVMAPGFRIGWMEAPRDIINATTTFKQAIDLHTNTFGQLVAAEFLHSYAEEYWPSIRAHYRLRRDAAVEAVEKKLSPMIVSSIRPNGGFFLWLELEEGRDSTNLLRPALRDYNVAYVPGEPFFALNASSRYLRLSFSSLSPSAIQDGIGRMAGALAT